jgi:hypothetical protein
MKRSEWDNLFKQYGDSVEGLRKTFERCVHSGATVHQFNNHMGLIYYALDSISREYENCGESLSVRFYECQQKFLRRLNNCAEWLGNIR